MKILCLFQKFSFRSSTIYLDLVRELVRSGHEVFVLAGTTESLDEKRIYEEQGCKAAYVCLPDQFHAGKIKKGLVQLLMEPKMMAQIRRHFWKEPVDLILYPTPPITLAGVVEKTKKHYRAKTYLMLKDIFPQNAVDLGMMSENGMIHRYFKGIERRLYGTSDMIGCMSPANVEYMKKQLPPSEHDKLTLFPNTVEITEMPLENSKDDSAVRFVFGGNLGKPQAIDFLLQGIEALKEEKNAHFLIIGDGTESHFVEKAISERKLTNAEYHRQLPRREYEDILKKQDVGLVLLSSRFTIPNFPSRVLSYMQMAKPVLAVTDRVSDIGRMITEEAHCGYFAPSDDVGEFVRVIRQIVKEKKELLKLGQNGRNYLISHYNVKDSVKKLEQFME